MTKMNTDILPKGLILCAVSGGADSMYLLCRLRELGCPVAAAHFNHGLRTGEADRDEAFVKNFCESQNIPFTAGRGDVSRYARENRLSTEDAARQMRYAFLEETARRIGASAIATAHTADDNAETVLLHLIRGAGLGGLGGIPPVRGNLRRPMLSLTRQEVESYLRERDIPFVTDSTNEADDYARNRLRHRVLPALREENPALERAVGRMTALLREDEEFLSGLAADFVRQFGSGKSLPADKLAALPKPIARRVVRQMAGRSITAEQTEAVLHIAQSGGFTHIGGLEIGCSEGQLVFGAKARAPLPDRVLPVGQEVYLPEAGLRARCEPLKEYPAFVNKPFNTFFFPYENIYGNITVTARKPGDKYRPAGRGCTKTLKALFMEKGVPSWERESVPVLRDDMGILGVYGFPPAERAAARPGDGGVLKVEFLPATPDERG